MRHIVTSVALLLLAGCAPDPGLTRSGFRQTMRELALESARQCDSGFEYPQSLVDGIGRQLVEELRCMDDTRLIFYQPCREPGCIFAAGPQPLAMRPEVFQALGEAALAKRDFISISAAYRDVAMQYYSRWYVENCDANFNAAVPGTSNHQGGRAIDVVAYNFWWNTLLEVGFEHPIPSDEPHFELTGDAQFVAESTELQSLSVLAFERLWNRNHPEAPIAEDGLYDEATKAALGEAPVEGFTVGACDAGAAPDAGTGLDGGGDVALDAGDAEGPDASTADAADGTDTGTDAVRSDVISGDALGDGLTVQPGRVPTTLQQLQGARDASATAAGGTDGCNAGGAASGWIAVAIVALLRRRRRAG